MRSKGRKKNSAKSRLQELAKEVNENKEKFSEGLGDNNEETIIESTEENNDLEYDGAEDKKIDKLNISIDENIERNSSESKEQYNTLNLEKNKHSKNKKSTSSKKAKQSKEEKTSNKSAKTKAVVAVAIVAIAGAAYCSVAYGYYGNRLLPNTFVNGVDYSNKTSEQLVNEFNNQIKTYNLTIKKNGEVIETIKGSDLGVVLTKGGEDKINAAIDKQNNLLWPLCFKNKANLTIEGVASPDSDKLDQMFSDLKTLSIPFTREFQDARVVFRDNKFIVCEPVLSDKIDEGLLKENILQKASSLSPELNLDDGKCYEQNDSTVDMESLQKVCDAANKKFPNLNVTIKLGETDINLAEELIPNALIVNDDGSVDITSESLNMSIKKAASQYSTVGGTVDFKTAHGDVVQVSGGDYGNVMKTDGLKQLLEKGVLKGEAVNASVPYTSNCLNNNPKIETTYVEIDLTNQYLYMFVNGKKVVETPVVTGRTGARATPQGVYMLKNKIMDVPLVGDNYVTPVKYWMPFNGGIGLHDAVWQSAFGGERYKTKGSHGCVNLPMSKAKEIYNNAVVGMPVVCYYHDKLSGFDTIASPDPVMSTYRSLNSNEQRMLSDIKNGKRAEGAVYDSNVGENAKKYGNKNVSAESLSDTIENENIEEYEPEIINEEEDGVIKDIVITPSGVE